MANRHNEYAKKRRKTLLAEFDDRCKTCGCEEKLEFAHTHKTGLGGSGRGRKERLFDVIKNRDAYILLCKTCHKAYDRRPMSKGGQP